MLRITMSVSPEAAAGYFDSALEKADYYAKSEPNGKGVWGGKGAGRLGLSGEVRREDFVSLASNKSPDSDRNLTEDTKEKRRPAMIYLQRSEVGVALLGGNRRSRSASVCAFCFRR